MRNFAREEFKFSIVTFITQNKFFNSLKAIKYNKRVINN